MTRSARAARRRVDQEYGTRYVDVLCLKCPQRKWMRLRGINGTLLEVEFPRPTTYLDTNGDRREGWRDPWSDKITGRKPGALVRDAQGKPLTEAEWTTMLADEHFQPESRVPRYVVECRCGRRVPLTMDTLAEAYREAIAARHADARL